MDGSDGHGTDRAAGAVGAAAPAPAALGLLTALTLAAFAANSLLCRAALAVEGVDAATFTLLRLASGAAALALLVGLRRDRAGFLRDGSWVSAAALLGYALLFSLAYRTIPAGVGALVLFAAVQLTMLTAAVRAGHGPRGPGWAGVALALAGLAVLTLPGATAPDPVGTLLMAGSGVAWGLYSLRGRSARSATRSTAANFVRAALLALPAGAAVGRLSPPTASRHGVLLAIVSGAVTSGCGYALWYAVLPALGTTRAAVVQLAVPVLAAAAGLALLHEAPSPRLLAASAAILGGIALVLRTPRRDGAHRPAT